MLYKLTRSMATFLLQIFSNKYGKVAEDLTDSVEVKRALHSSSNAEPFPQALLKSPHVRCTYVRSF